MIELVTLGGRRFKVIDFDRRTVAQDHYLRREMALSGMDKCIIEDGETDSAWLVRLQTALVHSGRAQHLIAGFLLPEKLREQDWTLALAEETAQLIAGLSTREDRTLVDQLSMECAFGFFRQAVEQFKNFRDSLAARALLTQSEPSALTH